MIDSFKVAQLLMFPVKIGSPESQGSKLASLCFSWFSLSGSWVVTFRL